MNAKFWHVVQMFSQVSRIPDFGNFELKGVAYLPVFMVVILELDRVAFLLFDQTFTCKEF